LNDGLRLIQLREKDWPEARRDALAVQLVPLAHRFGAQVLLNGTFEDARRLDCDGVHWTSTVLAQASRRPAGMLVAASCHTRAGVARAGELDLDFAVLGPVAPTPTHPDAVPLGWDGFAAIVAGARLPVYALGGLRGEDLLRATDCGAQGVALRRAAWAKP
jgi:8-oxo-dGTP diphosphatase